VRPSVLEAAIADAGIALPVELARIDSSKEAALTGSYSPPGTFPKGELFELTCQSVPLERVAEVRSELESEAIPQFVEWAKHIEALDHHSPVRREHQHFKWAYPDATR
jgi:hypothetical protein